MMLNQAITYEEPAGQLIRACLRIERLFQQLQETSNKPNTWCSHLSIACLLDLIKILEKSQLKTNLAKELQRQLARLQPLMQANDIDHKRLQHIINQLNNSISNLRNLNGKLGAGLRENAFLQSVNNHLRYPASYFSYDNPNYFHWLHLPLPERLGQLTQWLHALQPAYEAVEILLQLIRENNSPRIMTVDNGLYQAQLDKNTSCQLVRISLPETMAVFPKTSLSKHRLSIQFYNACANSRPALTNEPITFELTICAT